MDISSGKTIVPRSRAEIVRLKANWRLAPCWNIEDAEGFELHREELVAFRLACQAQWMAQQYQQILDFAGPMLQQTDSDALKITIQQLQAGQPNVE